MVSGTDYYLQISDGNTDEQIYVKVIQANGDTLTLATPIETPAEYSVYSFGQVNRHAKMMRILSITTADDLKRKITAVEYNEDVYADTVVLPVPKFVNNLETRDITAYDYIRYNASGVLDTVVSLSWYGASMSYKVYYKKLTDTEFTYAGTARNTTFEISGLTDKETYIFRVDNATYEYTVQGKSTPPDPVSNLTGHETGNIFTLRWDYEYKPLDFKQFIVYHDDALLGSTLVNTFTTPWIPATMNPAFQVFVEDQFGNLSQVRSIVIPITEVPAVNGVTGSIINGQLTLDWSYINKPSDFSHYEVYDINGYLGSSTNEKFQSNSVIYTNPNFTVVAVDTSSNKSLPVHVELSLTQPQLVNISHLFNNGHVEIQWDVLNGSYPIVGYSVELNGDTTYTSDNHISVPVTWVGDLNATITATDTAGHNVTVTHGILVVAPSQPIVNSTVSTTVGIEFSWVTAKGSIQIKEYVVNYNGNIIVSSDPYYFVPTKQQGTYNLQVYAVDYAGNNSPVGTKTVNIVSPSISNITGVTSGRYIKLNWLSYKGSFNIKEYLVEYDTTSVFVTTTEALIEPTWTGSKTFTVTAIDLAGNKGQSVQYVHEIQAPASPVITSTVIGKDVVFTTQQTAKSFALEKLEVAYDSRPTIDIGIGNATWTLPIFWDGSLQFYFTSVDIHGNRSEVAVEEVTITEAVVDTVTAEIVDNNVLLRWTATQGTLPIDSYIIAKGTNYTTAEVIGSRKGTFSTTFESESGEYTYWVTPVDSAGNTGRAHYVRASVSQPPDFILNVKWLSSWANAQGINANAEIRGEVATLPVDTIETFSGHFSTNAWNSPSDQVASGYPLWLTPSTGYSQYYEVFDYGTILGNTNITLTDPMVLVNGSGNYTMHRQISSSLDGSSWTNHPEDITMLFLASVRYVKVTYTFTTDQTMLLDIGQFTVRLDSKIKNDAGNNVARSYDCTWERTGEVHVMTCANHGLQVGDEVVVTACSSNQVDLNTTLTISAVTADTFTIIHPDNGPTSGTVSFVKEYVTCSFNTQFVDVMSITVTAGGTVPAVVLYDFIDVPNPTSFKVRMYDMNGFRISGTFSWAARGY
jgi:hypothetical protein